MAAVTDTSDVSEGIVVHFGRNRFYGFISTSSTRDIYFRMTAYHGKDVLRHGDTVRFTVTVDGKSRACATAITLVNHVIVVRRTSRCLKVSTDVCYQQPPNH